MFKKLGAIHTSKMRWFKLPHKLTHVIHSSPSVVDPFKAFLTLWNNVVYC